MKYVFIKYDVKNKKKNNKKKTNKIVSVKKNASYKTTRRIYRC